MAKDMATGKDQKITITANSGLNDKDVERMVAEAKDHEEEDRRRREEVERRNKLDNLCYTLEKQISENKDKLQGVDLSSIEGLIREGRSAIEKQDDAKVTDVLARLEREAHAMASKLYEQAGGPGGPPPPSGNGNGGGKSEEGGGKRKGDVIDAEFEEGA
jgi:molecular chaperone DnaK